MESTQKSSPPPTEIDLSISFNLKCKFCSKILSSRQNFREHLYIHTGERPYVCKEPGCGEAFRQGSLLSIHKKMHTEINKGQRKSSKVLKRCNYPTLAQLISCCQHPQYDKVNEEENTQWIEKIGAENFEGFGKYIISAFMSLNNRC